LFPSGLPCGPPRPGLLPGTALVVVAVTAQPVAPVIPPSLPRSGQGRRKAGPSRPLPLAGTGVPPAVPDGVVYGIGRIDASGRIADRAVTGAMGWRAGDLLTLTALAGVVTVRRDPGGMTAVGDRAYIPVPAPLRRRCGLRPGDRVFLAAAPASGTLTAYSLAVVHEAISTHGTPQHASTGGKP
jgi:hypothetical protein